MSSQPQCIRIIRAEHEALSAMLRSLQLMIKSGPGSQAERFFSVVRAMLVYITEYPERLHHPKESELLFPAVADQSLALRAVVERLEREHARGEASVQQLMHLLAAWECIGAPRRAAFEEALERYVGFYLEHMRIEETIVLPEAQKVLSADAWARLDAAFAANRDPLAGHGQPEAEYDRLFSLITQRAPAPIGVGAA